MNCAWISQRGGIFSSYRCNWGRPRWVLRRGNRTWCSAGTSRLPSLPRGEKVNFFDLMYAALDTTLLHPAGSVTPGFVAQVVISLAEVLEDFRKAVIWLQVLCAWLNTDRVILKNIYQNSVQVVVSTKALGDVISVKLTLKSRANVKPNKLYYIQKFCCWCCYLLQWCFDVIHYIEKHILLWIIYST